MFAVVPVVQLTGCSWLAAVPDLDVKVSCLLDHFVHLHAMEERLLWLLLMAAACDEPLQASMPWRLDLRTRERRYLILACWSTALRAQTRGS